MLSVAWIPVFDWLVDWTQDLYHVNWKASGDHVILLYILMIFLASLPAKAFRFASNHFISSSVHFSKCHNHIIMLASRHRFREMVWYCFFHRAARSFCLRFNLWLKVWTSNLKIKFSILELKRLLPLHHYVSQHYNTMEINVPWIGMPHLTCIMTKRHLQWYYEFVHC